MNHRSHLRLGTLLWFALLGATIAITLHQQRVASRINSLVDENRALRAEADRLAATVEVLVLRLDEADLEQRITDTVLEQRFNGLDLSQPGDRRWAPPFAAWELERLWGLDAQQATICAQALQRLHLTLRADGDQALVTRAFDRFHDALPSTLSDEQRQAIGTWSERAQAVAAHGRPAAPEANDASF